VEGVVVLLWLAACAALVGLEELTEVPEAFPLELRGETGRITSPPGGGQVSVDLAFEEEDEARRAWGELKDEAISRGFSVIEEGPVDKRERVVLQGPGGRVVLDCCPKRVDRQRLVLVSWFAP
jgi:hypothetical protein